MSPSCVEVFSLRGDHHVNSHESSAHDVHCHLGSIGRTGALTDGLVAYYAFDDGSGSTLAELTGKGTDGELFNFPEDNSQWVAGQIGGALEFDGIDDYVIAPEYSLATDSLSVSAWVRANDLPVWGSILKNWGDSIVGQFHFGLGPGSAGTLNVFITQGDGSAFNAGTDPDQLPLEEWQHVAFIADAANQTVTLYRNGENVDERPYDGTFTQTPNSSALGIGVKTNNLGEIADAGNPGYWNGRLDDMGLWTRALSPTEIADIYQKGLMGQPIGPPAGTPGDFNNDGVLDAVDIDGLTVASASKTNPPKYDLNDDDLVNLEDVNIWVKDLKRTWIGDADLNLEFNSGDFVQAFIAGKYELDEAAVWSDGDWDGSGRFDSSDFVAAFIDGGYELGPRPPAAVSAVPEPSTVLLLLGGVLFLATRRRRV